MKTIFLSIPAMILSLYASAQPDKPFKLEAGAAFNMSSNKINSTKGLALYLEPKYTFTDRFQLAWRIEPSVLANGISADDRESIKSGSNFLLTNSVTGEYFLTGPDKKTRPFIGVSLSLHSQNRYVVISTPNSMPFSRREYFHSVGFGPRAGLDMGRTRLLTTLNITGREFTNYVGFNVGYEFGQKKGE